MVKEFISHYRILEKIGEGGMGIVYKALDQKLDRTVAVKPSQYSNHDTHKQRFLYEGRAAYYKYFSSGFIYQTIRV